MLEAIINESSSYTNGDLASKRFMKIKERIAQNKILRTILFPILRHLDFEIKWKHDITKRPFYLKFWSHKGYWFYGKDREPEEIYRFKDLICDGDSVLEIGAHIGYLTQYFEALVGDRGAVMAIEPTPSSRHILNKNINSKTNVLEYACSSYCGQAKFHVEAFGGFTNSLSKKFAKKVTTILENTQNRKHSQTSAIEVEVITIDALCIEHNYYPDFIKIDAEGVEYEILLGATAILKQKPKLMVEIADDGEALYSLLKANGYQAFDASGAILNSIDGITGNIFFKT